MVVAATPPTPDDRIRAALWFAERGFGVFSVWSTTANGTCRCSLKGRCESPGKHPIPQTGFKAATTEPDLIRTMLSAGSDPNWGMLPPEGVFILDVDGAGVGHLAELEERHGRLPDTLRTNTAHGQHVFLRWPADLPRPIGQLFGFVTRWGSGRDAGYVIGPRSIHASGVVYVPAGTTVEIAELPQAWAQAAVSAPEPVIVVGAGYHLPDRVGAGESRYEAIRGYTAHLYNTSRLEVAEMWPLVRDVLAPRFAEPLAETELRARFDRVVNKMPARLGERRGLPNRNQEPVPDQLRYWTPREIAEATSADVDWVVTGYVARQAITELDGKVKAAGKTTLALSLVRCLVGGEAFLDQTTVVTRVVYLTEQQPGPFREALERAHLLDVGDEIRVLYRRDVSGYAWPALVAKVAADARDDGYGLLVVDTLGKLAGLKDENDASEASKAMAPLQDAAHDGLAVLVLRHERKGGGEVGESARGSSAFSGDVDIILQLRRPEGNQPRNRRVIESLSRYGETPEKVVAELLDTGYHLLGEAEAVALGEAIEKVSALLGVEEWAETNGPTLDELLKSVPDLKRSTVQRALASLEGMGELVITGAGRRGDPRRFRVVPPTHIELSAQSSPLGEWAETQSEDIPPPPPDPMTPGTVACDDYRAHQFAHRLTVSGWVCDTCHPEGVPA